MFCLIDFLLAVALIGLVTWTGYETQARFARKGYFKPRQTTKNQKISRTQFIAIVGLAVTAVLVGGIGMVCLLFNASC
jgi:nitric oxide reductase large subunit